MLELLIAHDNILRKVLPIVIHAWRKPNRNRPIQIDAPQKFKEREGFYTRAVKVLIPWVVVPTATLIAGATLEETARAWNDRNVRGLFFTRGGARYLKIFRG
jgi:hypothetical protein